MGLKKWILTYGPGSPGSVAKAMAKTYNNIKKSCPNASERQLLEMVLKSRIDSNVLWGYSPMSLQQISIKDVKNLADLTWKVELAEDQDGTINSLFLDNSGWETIGLIRDVIEEVTKKYAPQSFN